MTAKRVKTGLAVLCTPISTVAAVTADTPLNTQSNADLSA